MGQRQLTLDLTDRSEGHVQETEILGRGGACTAFDNVGGGGDHRTAQLRGQPELFGPREFHGGTIDRQGKGIRQMEGSELVMIPQWFLLNLNLLEYSLRAATNSLQPSAFSPQPSAFSPQPSAHSP